MSNEFPCAERSAEAKAIDSVWLGDLSGWQIITDVCAENTEINHRCGFCEWVNSEYLGNIITNIVIPHMEEGCQKWRDAN